MIGAQDLGQNRPGDGGLGFRTYCLGFSSLSLSARFGRSAFWVHLGGSLICGEWELGLRGSGVIDFRRRI